MTTAVKVSVLTYLPTGYYTHLAMALSLVRISPAYSLTRSLSTSRRRLSVTLPIFVSGAPPNTLRDQIVTVQEMILQRIDEAIPNIEIAHLSWLVER